MAVDGPPTSSCRGACKNSRAVTGLFGTCSLRPESHLLIARIDWIWVLSMPSRASGGAVGHTAVALRCDVSDDA